MGKQEDEGKERREKETQQQQQQQEKHKEQEHEEGNPHTQAMNAKYGDCCATCTTVNFADSRGRVDPNRQTPVADAQNIVKIILLLPGEQAARVRATPLWR